MEKDSRTLFSIQNLTALFTVILGTNYYLSYRWFDGILKNIGINSLAIVTLDDLTFLFIKFNIKVISLASIGFISIFLVNFYISIIENNPVENLRITYHKFIRTLKREKWFKFFFILILIILVLLLYKVVLIIGKLYLLYILILIIIIIPVFYYFNPQNRRFFFIVEIVLMFIWSDLFISHVLEESKSSISDKKVIISFMYNNCLVKTDNNLNFIFQSYKYTILSDSNKLLHFYENVNIKNLKYKELKINKNKTTANRVDS